LPDLAALAANIHMQKELGLVKVDLDIPAYADLSLVKEAAQRIHLRQRQIRPSFGPLR